MESSASKTKIEDMQTDRNVQKNSVEELNETEEGELTLRGYQGFSGPVSERKCTNVCTVLVFIVFNIGLAAFAVYSN